MVFKQRRNTDWGSPEKLHRLLLPPIPQRTNLTWGDPEKLLHLFFPSPPSPTLPKTIKQSTTTTTTLVSLLGKPPPPPTFPEVVTKHAIEEWEKAHISYTRSFLRLKMNVIVDREKEWLRNHKNFKPESKIFHKKKKKINRAPAPSIPENMLKTILALGGTDLHWINKKLIFPTDITPSENRLLLPSQLEEVLTHSEKSFLKESLNHSMKVSIVTEQYQYHDQFPCLTLKYWPSILRFVFTTEWMEFVRRNNLQSTQQLEIWSFRQPQQNGGDTLAFAINLCTREQQ